MSRTKRYVALGWIRIVAEPSHDMVSTVAQEPEASVIRLAEASRRLGNGVQHRLESMGDLLMTDSTSAVAV
jgi:hypothetical protein